MFALALAAATACFLAVGGGGRQGNHAGRRGERRGRGGRSGSGNCGPRMDGGIPSSMRIRTWAQMPLRACEMFLSALPGEPGRALWTIELRTHDEETSSYVPRLMREITSQSDMAEEHMAAVHVPMESPPETAPTLEVQWEFDTTDGRVLRGGEHFNGPVFLVHVEALPHLTHHVGPDRFAAPEEMLGQSFSFLTVDADMQRPLVTQCLVVSDGVFNSMQQLTRSRVRRGF